MTEVSWQGLQATPTERLAALYHTQNLTDLTLTFRGGSATMQVHKLVLAMSSPVFERMLFGSLEVRDRLTLNDDSPDAFEWLRKYLYLGETRFDSPLQAVDVYGLAHKYRVEALVTLCSKHLQDNLVQDIFPAVYDCGVAHQDANLLNKCISFLIKKSPTILTSLTFTELSRRAVGHIIRQNARLGSHVALFLGLMQWGQGQTRHDQSGDTWLREIIQDFLPYINFLSMTADEFVRHVMPSEVFTNEESCAILMNIQNMTNVPMPQLTRLDGAVNDESNILKATVTVRYWANDTRRIGITQTANRRRLLTVSVARPVLLAKIQLHSNPFIFDHSQEVAVTEETDREVVCVRLEGDLATFDDPILLVPRMEYYITLKEDPNSQSRVVLGARPRTTREQEEVLTLFYWFYSG